MADMGEKGFSRTKRVDMEARLVTIQNAKERCIGVDKQALDGQVTEKASRAEQAKNVDEMHANMAQYFDQKLVMLEQERRQVKAELNRELVGFRSAYQGVETRREYDMSDPEYLKKALPARVGDDDPRLGVSSIQVFEGEDLLAGQRRKAQMAQQAAWVAQQSNEKMSLQAQQDAAEKSFSALQDQQISVQNQVAGMTEMAKKEMRRDTAEFNKMLADAKRNKEQAEKEWEEQANAIDQSNVLASPYMTEDPRLAASMMGPHRVRPDHWKGMSEAQKSDVFNERAQQRHDMHLARIAAKEAEALEAHNNWMLTKALEIKASEVEQFKREQAVSVADFRSKQAVLKKERDDELKQTYTNVPTQDFFSQFGTSAR